MSDLITDVDILDEAKECFLTYSAEVLTDRAIPSVEDGLLSSQRKILWTMIEVLKMNSKGKTKKCQALVGSTLSTAYTHGDASCYGVLCKLSQNYLMRYPLIQGQGSLGTQEDNDLRADSRYTEAKPSIYADLMMQDFKKNVVPLKETYNGEYMEPVFLPSSFPNSICNGRQAIGISMASNTLPHCLSEVCDALLLYIKNNRHITLDEILQNIKGPDFPLGGTILNSQDIKEAFRTGKSKVSLKVQGDYKIEGQKITFTTIPYRTYRNKIREQINKNIDELNELIDDFTDESALGQNCLIFKIKDGVSTSKALDRLFALTDLQTTVSYNMNYIVNGTPKLCSMEDLIREYITHQEQVLIKATEFDKDKAEKRAHILRGLIAAVDKIDEVIELIKASNNKQTARVKLINFLSVDEIQADAILDMKLGKLTKIDKEELINELKEKEDFIKQCAEILSSELLRNEILIDKITRLKADYGDDRRTRLLSLDIKKEKKEPVVIEPKDCVVVINQKGLIKRIDLQNFKPQKRNTVGIKTNGDLTIFSQKTNTQDILMVFTNKGKMYRMLVDNIPEGSNASIGINLSGLIQFDNGELPIAFTTINRDTDKKFIFFATKKGVVKKVLLEEYDKIKRTGVIAINFKQNDELASVTFVNDEQIILLTKQGMAIRFATADMPISSRTAQGVKGMNISENDYLIDAIPISKDDEYLAVISEQGLGKRVKLSEFVVQNRGGKGISCYRDNIAGGTAIKETDNLFISGNKSSIILNAKELPILTRVSNGNAMIKNNNYIVSVTKV